MDRLLYPQRPRTTRPRTTRPRTTRPAIPPNVASWLDGVVLEEQPPSISQRIVRELWDRSLEQEGYAPARYIGRRGITTRTFSLEQPAQPRGTGASSPPQGQIDPIRPPLGSFEVMGGENGSSPSTYAAYRSTGRSGRTGRTSRGRRLRVDTLVSAPGMSILAILKDRRRNDIEPYSPTTSTSSKTTDCDYPPYFS